MPLPGDRVSWAVIHNVPRAEAKAGEGKLSEWGPEASAEMANFVRHQPSPFKGTLGDIIDKTPKELISKIMLEEKYFESWYDGRVVLLGDGKSFWSLHPESIVKHAGSFLTMLRPSLNLSY